MYGAQYHYAYIKFRAATITQFIDKQIKRKLIIFFLF